MCPSLRKAEPRRHCWATNQGWDTHIGSKGAFHTPVLVTARPVQQGPELVVKCIFRANSVFKILSIKVFAIINLGVNYNICEKRLVSNA